MCCLHMFTSTLVMLTNEWLRHDFGYMVKYMVKLATYINDTKIKKMRDQDQRWLDLKFIK